MAGQFLLGLRDVPLVRGDGNHLPLASGAIDILTYAQSWHWTDRRASVPEARRVLRRGGALALWWSDSASTVGWTADQDARLQPALRRRGRRARSRSPVPWPAPGTQLRRAADHVVQERPARLAPREPRHLLRLPRPRREGHRGVPGRGAGPSPGSVPARDGRGALCGQPGRCRALTPSRRRRSASRHDGGSRRSAPSSVCLAASGRAGGAAAPPRPARLPGLRRCTGTPGRSGNPRRPPGSTWPRRRARSADWSAGAPRGRGWR